MKLALLFLYVSIIISIVEAGRYDRNRKLGIRSGSLPMNKWIRDAQDPN